jgi:mRNA-degrading endonuclease toxin of MazEF toxin-antitoxin module
MQPERCDVVRSQDPFKTGADAQRPWLLINNERHPFDGEQYLAVAVSTKEYDHSVQLTPGVWEVGGVPQESYVSPWAVHSPRIEDLVAWQGRVTGEFTDCVVTAIGEYIE